MKLLGSLFRKKKPGDIYYWYFPRKYSHCLFYVSAITSPVILPFRNGDFPKVMANHKNSILGKQEIRDFLE